MARSGYLKSGAACPGRAFNSLTSRMIRAIVASYTDRVIVRPFPSRIDGGHFQVQLMVDDRRRVPIQHDITGHVQRDVMAGHLGPRVIWGCNASSVSSLPTSCTRRMRVSVAPRALQTACCLRLPARENTLCGRFRASLHRRLVRPDGAPGPSAEPAQPSRSNTATQKPVSRSIHQHRWPAVKAC